VEPAFVVFLVGQGGVEPPTLGFSVLKGQKINNF